MIARSIRYIRDGSKSMALRSARKGIGRSVSRVVHGAAGAKGLTSEKRRQEVIANWKGARKKWPLWVDRGPTYLVVTSRWCYSKRHESSYCKDVPDSRACGGAGYWRWGHSPCPPPPPPARSSHRRPP